MPENEKEFLEALKKEAAGVKTQVNGLFQEMENQLSAVNAAVDNFFASHKDAASNFANPYLRGKMLNDFQAYAGKVEDPQTRAALTSASSELSKIGSMPKMQSLGAGAKDAFDAKMKNRPSSRENLTVAAIERVINKVEPIHQPG